MNYDDICQDFVGKDKLLPKYQTQGWEQWAADWAGDSLTCPGCSEPIINPNTMMLREKNIIKENPEVLEAKKS